jgi:UDP-2,3-diacylglucosamine pyrophosphatase LpxH
MGSVRTIVVSDLHLGVANGADVARFPDARARLLRALDSAERVVLLGDTIELRQRPLPELLRMVESFFQEAAETVAGKRVTLVPGNHDHAIAEPYLLRWRLDGASDASELEWPVEHGDGIAGRLAEWMPQAEVSLAYPGFKLRPDVYLTHGHYLDMHLTVPRLESLIASGLARVAGRDRSGGSTADYEAVLGPMYAFNHALAQSASPKLQTGSLSRVVWQRATGPGPVLARFLIGKVTIPGAVAIINRVGLGPFSSVLTAEELRRSGLRAMADVVRSLGVETDHVLFGHTHRPGPLPGDDVSEWKLPGGGRLWNTGSWYHERVLMNDQSHDSPYWPGTVAWIGDDGPPELQNLLPDVELREVQPVRAR